MAIWAYLLAGLAAGAMLRTQFGIDAHLAAWVGGTVRAGFVSFLVGARSSVVAFSPWAQLSRSARRRSGSPRPI